MAVDWEIPGKLSKYLTLFPNETKERVMRQILEGELLKNFMATPEGKLIVNTQMARMSTYLSGIMRFCLDGIDNNKEEVSTAARQLKLSYDFLCDLATIEEFGDKHKEGIKKVNENDKGRSS